jgi:hypothetical protein
VKPWCRRERRAPSAERRRGCGSGHGCDDLTPWLPVGRGLRTTKARARCPGLARAAGVRPLGFEPRTCGLRVRCSAIELEALGTAELTTAVLRSRSLQRRRPPASRGRPPPPWGGRGDLNPRPPGPQPGALTGLSYGHHGSRQHRAASWGAGQTGSVHRGVWPGAAPRWAYPFGHAPVAQLDRAAGFYPAGSGFDSWRGHCSDGGCSVGRFARPDPASTRIPLRGSAAQ